MNRKRLFHSVISAVRNKITLPYKNSYNIALKLCVHRLSLCSRTYSSYRCIHSAVLNKFSDRPSGDISQENGVVSENSSERQNLNTIKKKIFYNSLMHERYQSQLNESIAEKRRLKRSYVKRKSSVTETAETELPLFLKYTNSAYDELVDSVSTEKAQEESNESEEYVFLPYNVDYISEWKKSADQQSDILTNNFAKLKNDPGHWMSDYEFFAESETEECLPWEINYGTPNKRIPISKVPCGGCGALLHCQDHSIPGYLPSEIFAGRSNNELRSLVCQRCHFLKMYNTALNVNVSPEEYPKIISEIKDKFALVILIIDLTDFPCSIWPNILDIIGNKRPVVIVGNKVDLLPQDSPNFLEHVKNCLTVSVIESGLNAANIKTTMLISAKTGFGVEDLITKLHHIWEYQGDVYLIGCTNVGKSSLFNALLQSDFCKVQAVDLVQRATTAPWPGTTLNLLKFPILRPSDYRIALRMKRIIAERKIHAAESKFRKLQLLKTKDPTYATLIGHIGRTFKENLENEDFSAASRSPIVKQFGINPDDKIYSQSKWCFDTPGTVKPDQILHHLTTEELVFTLPRSLIVPRTLRLFEGTSLFIAGLARLDYLQGSHPVRFTVFASGQLPITVCNTEDAEKTYGELLGTEYFAVPMGGPERLSRWPNLSPSPKIFEVVGINDRESACDIVLSSTGWVAVTVPYDSECTLRGWTPLGQGIYMRKPSLIRYAVNLRGPMIRKTPAYQQGKAVYIKHIAL